MRFFDWLTGREANRKMWAEHDYKMQLLRQLEHDPLSVDRDEFRRVWADNINGLDNG